MFMMALNPVILTFPIERAVFLREENSKFYNVTAYFIAKTLVELPILTITPIISVLIAYWMVGLNDDSAKTVITYLIIFVL